jgi:hypothetical protein
MNEKPADLTWTPSDGLAIRHKLTGNLVTLHRIEDDLVTHPWGDKLGQRWTGAPGSTLFKFYVPAK